ncbi:glycosyltransferase [Desulfobaculum sp.]
MRVLLVHPNFPAQFRHVARALGADSATTVVFATTNPRPDWTIPGVKKAVFSPVKAKAEAKDGDAHQQALRRLVTPFRDAAAQGEAMYRLAHRMKRSGFTPDVIYASSGWGPSLYLKDVWPETPLMCYFEWFYDPFGEDACFGRKPPPKKGLAPPQTLRSRNAAIFNDLWACEQGLSPTLWQRSQFPSEYHHKMAVLHDGVNTNLFRPRPGTPMQLKNCDLSGVREVITFAGRGMEPYRGFPQFLTALEMVLRRRPGAHAVIAGSERVCYGTPHPSGKSYKAIMLEELDLPQDRVHFVGALPYGEYRRMLAASSVHVYLTRPFVLSWSAIEAMASGCCLVVSDTSPVREAMRDGESAQFVDFADPKDIAAGMERVLDDVPYAERLRRGARETAVSRYSLEHVLPMHLRLIGNTANRGKVVHGALDSPDRPETAPPARAEGPVAKGGG